MSVGHNKVATALPIG